MIFRGLVVLLFALNLGLWGWVQADRARSLKSVDEAGLRADTLEVERPWLGRQADASAAVEVPTRAPIDLKQSQARLDSAIESAGSQVVQGAPLNQQCRQWGPFLGGDADRIAEALKAWPGNVLRQQRQVPVGYVVYLPRSIVEQGVGMKQLAAKGVREMFFIAGEGPLQGTISLGLFRDLERARLQQQDLLARGIAGVDIRERLGPSRVFFELRGTPQQVEALQGIYDLNPKSQLGVCADPERSRQP